uniref:Uncharacterized protein n=1 Tax=Tanacetum cinerariifolium TaxID=118510 RepID=A0A6L2LJG2_TANCI|nr:hypothetical protein [Tanacetum cinerariifolium]
MEPLKSNVEPDIQPIEVIADSGGSPKPELFVVYPGSVAARIKDRKGECGVMRSKERVRDEECKGMHVKCEAAMTDFKKNPVVMALREKISALSMKAKEHKLSLDRMMLESQKWAGYQQILLTLQLKVTALKTKKISDDMGSLVGKLVSLLSCMGDVGLSSRFAIMKEPFDLPKVKGYRSSYKKDHTQARKDLATATFLWLDEFVTDPSAPIESLLLKKPPTL